MRFAVDRLAMRLMHRAVDDTQLSVAWPEPPVLTSAADADDAAAIAAAVGALVVESELNDSQRSVVARLLRRTHGGAPFLLFGPFGTGKTRTLVEYVKQLIAAAPAAAAAPPPPPPPRPPRAARRAAKPPARRRTASARAAAGAGGALRVLICSPSNSSADALTLALKEKLPPPKLLRLIAASRHPKPEVRAYCKSEDEVKGVDALAGVSVVVSTTRTAGALASAAVPRATSRTLSSTRRLS